MNYIIWEDFSEFYISLNLEIVELWADQQHFKGSQSSSD